MSDQAGEIGEFQELLRRASGGDRLAQEELCQRYEQQVRIVVRVLLGPRLRQHVDSVDLMQSVHGCILSGLLNQKFAINSPEKLIALATTLARRKIARKWRTHRRQIPSHADPVDDSSITPAQPQPTSPDAHQDPQLVAEYNDVVRELVNHLSEPERIMLEMRLEGFSTQEIADILQVHPVAARVRWTRLKQRLQSNGIDRLWKD